MSLLGLDVGTSGCKAVAFTIEGGLIASAYREYPLYSPQPGWQELDPEEVWGCIRQTLGEVGAQTKSDPIQAMAVSSQGEACHGVDKNGVCLTRSVVTFDARTAQAPAWWLERKSKLEIAEITGMPLHGMYSINKIRWFKEHEPEAYNASWKFLCYEDFVHLKLGLEPTMSHSLAARTMALDFKGGDWSSEILELAGIDRDKLPRTAPSGEVVGTIPNGIADELGLPRGIVVSTGGHDQPAGTLGAGIMSGGEAMYATGTVDAICPIFDQPVITEEMIDGNLCCYPSCVPGLYASLAFNFTGGSLLKWYRDNFGGEELREAEKRGVDVYEILCAQVPSEPESLLILPHFTVTGTPHFDTESRGVIAGLTLNTRREDIVSAILSGVTYEMKLNLELLQSSGVEIRRLKAIGGGAKSPVWVQRKADIMGMPVAVLETVETAALGVAMLAGKGAGLVEDLAAMASAVAHVKDVYEPDARRSAAYQELFGLYKDMYPAMRDVNHGLSRLTGQAGIG